MKTKTIVKHLNEMGYHFSEDESRMNYGLIGSLKKNGDIKIIIFPECIYVHDKDIAVTNQLLSYIKRIQKKFRELKQYPFGYGAHTKDILQEV